MQSEPEFRVRSVITKLRIPASAPGRRRGGGFSALTLTIGFAGLIGAGTLLLMLPVSSSSGEFTPPLTAFFTATSAVSVTGLVVVDTGTYWSFFGQTVILVLIQVGGLGFMTSATVLLLFLGRRIGLRQRLLLSESLSLERTGGLVRLVREMLVFTFTMEGIGALVFFLRFLKLGPLSVALFRALFHAVSAFNNAGFDVFGNFRSLTYFQRDAAVLIPTLILIFLGSISFTVLRDFIRVRRFSRLSLNSKIVLATTGVVVALGTAFYLLAEYFNPQTLGHLSFPYKPLNALFHAIARTAGFSSLSVSTMMDSSLFFTTLLMFTGGASGSVAGGIKVNTLGLLAVTIISTLRGRENAGAFGREFPVPQIYRTLVIIMVSLGIVVSAVLILSITEPFNFLAIFFEAVSAASTSGYSVGITPGLSVAGRLLIISLMFIGRLGPLTLATGLLERQHPSAYRYPQETVSIG